MSQQKQITGYSVTGQISRDANFITVYRGLSRAMADVEYNRASRVYYTAAIHTHYSDGTTISMARGRISK